MKAAALHKLLTRFAAHNVAKAKNHTAREREHRSLAEHFMAEVAKANKSELRDSETDPATFYADRHTALGNHEAADAKECLATAETCAECAKAFSATGKAAGFDDDLSMSNALPLPEGLTVAAPSVPIIRAVPRAGSAPLPATAENPLFSKIYGTDEME